METIEYVCGAECTGEQFHIRTDYPVIARPCVPELAHVLATKQATAMQAALERSAPFALRSVAAMTTDLFLPTDVRVHGAGVYRGVYSREWMYKCNREASARVTWAIGAADDRAAWDHCAGRLWIDLEEASLRAELEPNNPSGSSLGHHFQVHEECDNFSTGMASDDASIIGTS
jgi:hypothetical protein